MKHTQLLLKKFICVTCLGILSSTSLAIYGVAELTPEKPGFVRVWTREEKPGIVEIAFVVDMTHPGFRRSNTKEITFELRDKAGVILQTAIGSSETAKSAALAFARQEAPGGEINDEAKKIFVKEGAAFYWLLVRKVHLVNSRIIIRGDAPLKTEGEYWFSLNRFHAKSRNQNR